MSKTFYPSTFCLINGIKTNEVFTISKNVTKNVSYNKDGKTIEEISTEKVLVTHGREEGLLSYLKQKKVTCNALNLIGFEDADD